jgi:hypothetical protein
VDDLLFRNIFEKLGSGRTIIKRDETELCKLIKYSDEHPKKIILLKGNNNASTDALNFFIQFSIKMKKWFFQMIQL